MTDHSAALSFARDTLADADRHVRQMAPHQRDREAGRLIIGLAAAIRNLQAAYTAAHSELERAVADLAACRGVADGLRKDAKRLDWLDANPRVIIRSGKQHLRPLIDAAIKEQSHE